MDNRLERIRRAYRCPADYERGASLIEWMVGRRQRRVGEMASGLVLEIGIGSGRSLPAYGPRAAVFGGDLSRPMLLACRERARELGRAVPLVELDARRLPFAGAVFDAVVFTLCLCTIPEPVSALREALRVARPGARIVLLEHVRSHIAPIAWLQDAVSLVSGPLAEEYFNRRTAENAVAAGVEVERVERWGAGFFNLVEGRKPAG